jgi:hypothetical protein
MTRRKRSSCRVKRRPELTPGNRVNDLCDPAEESGEVVGVPPCAFPAVFQADGWFCRG